ncbi:hypothetical protein [Phenylobacterium sp.]|uniref:hypothetical protein n=1 Tax=Phenylobacterium sp. TaxID=1871053 RepID=UPI002719394B|nr:hypothetical protein [Phenylobacterium sp.]MDO8380716.1 hypothetical protein [Phenylobacterium sp.]
MNHCEFPYGVEAPLAFSSLSSLGWLLAGLELLVILALLARRAVAGKAPDTEVIAWKHATILVFAEAAAKAELANIYKARDNLLRAIEPLLGDVLRISAGLAAEVGKLRAVGEPAKPPPHPPHAPAPAHGPSPAGALTAHGPQVIVNVQGPGPGHGDPGHGGHGQDAPKPEPSLDDRLAEVRAAAGVFAEYWRNRSARLAELQSARDLLNRRGDLPADLEKLRAATTNTAKSGGARGGGDATSHRGLHTA